MITLTKFTVKEKFIVIISSFLIGLMAISAILIGGGWILINPRWMFLFLLPLFVIFVWIYYPVITRRDPRTEPIRSNDIIVVGALFLFAQFIDFVVIAILEVFGYAKFGLYVFVAFNFFLITVPSIVISKKGKERYVILRNLGWSDYQDYIIPDQILGVLSVNEFNKLKMNLQETKERQETQKVRDERHENYVKIGVERNKILKDLGWSEIYDYTHPNSRLGEMAENEFGVLVKNLKETVERKKLGAERNKIIKDLGLPEFNEYSYTDLNLGTVKENEFNNFINELKDKKEKEKQKYELLISHVIRSIEEFKPTKNWGNENNYHIELLGWLKREFPDIVEYEVQTGASRPDLVIKDIAIEIKGPTDSQAINTLPSKLIRYDQYYTNIIIVLFECNFSEQLFKEIQIGINRHFQNVTIIRK